MDETTTVVSEALELIEGADMMSASIEDTQMQSPIFVSGDAALSPVDYQPTSKVSPSDYFTPEQMDQDIMAWAAGDDKSTIPDPPVPYSYAPLSSAGSGSSFSHQINVNNPYDANSPEYQISSPPPAPEPCLSASSNSLPGISSLIGSSAHQPNVTLKDIPETLRFRYHSEIKDKSVTHNMPSDTSKKSIKMQVDNFIGQIMIVVDLVVDQATQQEHVNDLYFPTPCHNWQKVQKCLVLKDNQNSRFKTYELFGYGIERMKKDKTPGARSTPAGERMATDRVVFRFRFFFGDGYAQQVSIFSGVVTDSKSTSSTGDPKITHVNPTSARAHDQSEVTLLCENLNQKAKVIFFSDCPRFYKEAKVTFRHKKFAVVVEAPKFCSTAGGKANIQIECTGAGRSNAVEFTYKPESDVGNNTRKRSIEQLSQSSTDAKQKLSLLLQKKRSQGNLRTDSVHEDEDEPDCVGNGVSNSLTPTNVDSTKTLKDLCFGLAEFDIAFDEIFCKMVASSFEAMTSTNVDGLTPLAQAIMYNNAPVVKSFLSHMPHDVKDEVLAQTFGDTRLSHLLLISERKTEMAAMVVCMLDSLPDLAGEDVDGNTLLHLLVRKGSEDEVRRLVAEAKHNSRLADSLLALAQLRNHEGRTALHEAALHSLDTAAEALLEAGADVNAKSSKTELAPLHYAVLNGSVGLARRLLEWPRVAVNATTREGKTALDLTNDLGGDRMSQSDLAELRELLRSHNVEERYQESSDEEEEDDEDEEDEEEEEASSDEDYQDAVETITWDELKLRMTERLDKEKFIALAGRLDMPANKLKLFQKAKDPAKFFFHQVTSDKGRQLPAALAEVDSELASLAARLSV